MDESFSPTPSIRYESPRATAKKNSISNPKNNFIANGTHSWKPTILVVDDSGTNRKMLIRSMNSTGLFTCREAEDGVECLSIITLSMSTRQRKVGAFMQRFSRKSDETEKAGGGSPRSLKGLVVNAMQQQRVIIDAVLIDSNMPRMNGPEAIVEMRKIGYQGTIIGVSGGDDETMRQFMQAGADGVMQKPAKTNHLVKMLFDGFRKTVQKITDGDPSSIKEDGAPTTLTAASRSSLGNHNSPTISTIVSTMAHISRLRKFVTDHDDALAAIAAISTTTAAATPASASQLVPVNE